MNDRYKMEGLVANNPLRIDVAAMPMSREIRQIGLQHVEYFHELSVFHLVASLRQAARGTDYSISMFQALLSLTMLSYRTTVSLGGTKVAKGMLHRPNFVFTC